MQIVGMLWCKTQGGFTVASYYKRGNSYVIRVSCGYDTKGKQVYQSMTWKPEDSMTAKQIENEVNRQAVLFEEKCKSGFQSRVIKFEAFCEEWFEEYAKSNLRNTTYKETLKLRDRIYKAIGHVRMDDYLFASCFVNEGVDIISVSGALGHSVVSTTSNIYCHMLERSRAIVSEAISNALKFGA